MCVCVYIYTHIGLHMCACLRDIYTDLFMNVRMSVFSYLYLYLHIRVGAMCLCVFERERESMQSFPK